MMSVRTGRPPPPSSATVNVAATCVGTSALGPGRRSVVWVQGCPLRCPSCLAPQWIPDDEAQLVDAAELAEGLLADPEVDGLTFSGGEPMRQAVGLTVVARSARRIRDVSLICFTGYSLALLRSRPPWPGVAALLDEVDVLIDGPYVAARDHGRGLRGSDNQRVHHFSPRLASSGYDFENRTRTTEIRIGGDRDVAEVMLVGVPPPGLLATLDKVEERIRHEHGEESL